MGAEKWQILLELLTDKYKRDLSTVDKEDILSFCFTDEIRNTAEDFLKCFKATKKDSAVAVEKKEKGNKSFFSKDYNRSFHFYTESIYHAEKKDENLPLAYANRSLALQKMEHLTDSLADLEMAVAYGYPKEKLGKLLARKEKCLALLEERRRGKLENKAFQIPKVSAGENKNFVCASNLLNIYYDETRGRHVVAENNIAKGEILFVEKAVALVVVSEGICMQCLKTTLARLPCETCLDMTYCSVKCREESWKCGHFNYCGFGELFKSVGIGYLSLKVLTALTSGFDELKKKLDGFSEPEYKNGLFKFNVRGFESVYSLIHHFGEHEASDLFQYTMTALLLATYLKNHTNYFPPTSEHEDMKLVTGVILRHILQMICNGQTINKNVIADEEDYLVSSNENKAVATAICPSVSMMNHSCLPSVMISFCNEHVVVKAVKDIKRGEEVFNCYGVDARCMRKPLRQEILRNQYFFTCKCEACV